MDNPGEYSPFAVCIGYGKLNRQSCTKQADN
jgi:hypothetical protein